MTTFATKSEPALFAAATSVDITPNREVPLGAGDHEGEDWKIESQVEANMLALWVGEEDPFVFVSIDALYPGRDVEQGVREQLHYLPPENIVVAATHTHAAPMLDPSKPRLGEADEKHLSWTKKQISNGLDDLLDPRARRLVSAKAAKGRATHSVNRRFKKRIYLTWPPKFNYFRWAPNFWGATDETITTLELLDNAGAKVAVLWNYACHPVYFPRGRTVSSHYPGVIRSRLRRENGDDLPVLFFQGFSGDTRPTYLAEPKKPAGLRELYRRVRFGPSWVPVTEDNYKVWVGSLSRAVEATLQSGSELVIKGASASLSFEPREHFVSPAGAPVVFQALMLGKEFGMLAVSSELVAGYNKQVRKVLGTRFSMPVSCTGETVGYLPLEGMLKDGGYEVDGFLENFGLLSVSPDVEKNAKAAIRGVIGDAQK